MFKITYLLNTIPQIGEYMIHDKETDKFEFFNKDKSLMDMCQESDELELFNSLAIQDVIDFKWTEFAYKIHLVGCFFHFFYMTILIIYINAIYVIVDAANAQVYQALLIFGILYPMWYDFSQLYKAGVYEYF